MIENKALKEIINRGLLTILDLEQYCKNGYYFLLEDGKIKEIKKER